MVYTHVLNRAGGRGIESPADMLFGRANRARADTRQLTSQPKLLPAGTPEDPELEADQEDDDDPEAPDAD